MPHEAWKHSHQLAVVLTETTQRRIEKIDLNTNHVSPHIAIFPVPTRTNFSAYGRWAIRGVGLCNYVATALVYREIFIIVTAATSNAHVVRGVPCYGYCDVRTVVRLAVFTQRIRILW